MAIQWIPIDKIHLPSLQRGRTRCEKHSYTVKLSWYMLVSFVKLAFISPLHFVIRVDSQGKERKYLETSDKKQITYFFKVKILLVNSFLNWTLILQRKLLFHSLSFLILDVHRGEGSFVEKFSCANQQLRPAKWEVVLSPCKQFQVKMTQNSPFLVPYPSSLLPPILRGIQEWWGAISKSF